MQFSSDKDYLDFSHTYYMQCDLSHLLFFEDVLCDGRYLQAINSQY